MVESGLLESVVTRRVLYTHGPCLCFAVLTKLACPSSVGWLQLLGAPERPPALGLLSRADEYEYMAGPK